mmetsp:Transcript_72/g.130  ORF Transcript_72/g.130 Transcript_72/m.130 type:complete len:104 (+) Transcript_72:811-1122(+)
MSGSHTGDCYLSVNIDNVRGVSFSMKTVVAGNIYGRIIMSYSSGDYDDVFFTSIGSSGGWKEYWLPTVKSSNELQWKLSQYSGYFDGTESIWLKDVKVWFDET